MQAGQSIDSLFPYGAATQAEVVNIVRMHCIDEDVKNLPDIITSWREAAKHFLSVLNNEIGLAETIDTQSLDTKYAPKLESVSSDYLFQQSFSLLPIEFQLVEISKLVAAQRLVNLEKVEALQRALPTNPTIDDLIEFCIAPKHQPPAPKVMQLAPNAFGFSSPENDFRFLGGYIKPLSQDDIKAALGGGLPVGAIVLLVGYGSSVCNVLAVGKRMILNNGFHRLYALAELGIKYAPIVVQRVTNTELEFPPQVAGLPKQYLLENERPLLMKDFFDEKLTTRIHRKASMRSLQIGWDAQVSLVPI